MNVSLYEYCVKAANVNDTAISKHLAISMVTVAYSEDGAKQPVEGGHLFDPKPTQRVYTE